MDPPHGTWVERIDYAGAADNIWGPYTIGFLQWDGEKWADTDEPYSSRTNNGSAGVSTNRISFFTKVSGKCGMSPDRIMTITSFTAESEDGQTDWGMHLVFAAPEMKTSGLCVRQRGDAFDAVFARGPVSLWTITTQNSVRSLR